MLIYFIKSAATTEIYTLSLHDALPICRQRLVERPAEHFHAFLDAGVVAVGRSEEHTSELQSHSDLVCRLLLEKKKNIEKITYYNIKHLLEIDNELSCDSRVC